MRVCSSAGKLWNRYLFMNALRDCFVLQVFLVAVDTSRHGCHRSSLLGNGVVVCLCVWAGLSCIFWILSFLIAPKLKLVQFVSTVGYSFFGWGLSLMLSIAFEVLEETSFSLPPALPLIAVGLSAAIKHVLLLLTALMILVGNTLFFCRV